MGFRGSTSSAKTNLTATLSEHVPEWPCAQSVAKTGDVWCVPVYLMGDGTMGFSKHITQLGISSAHSVLVTV